MIAYHFVDKTLRDGRPIPPDGQWLRVNCPLEMCKRGLHASKHVADALKYAPGSTLCLVELGGEIIEGNDKVVAQWRRILARFDATELLRADARASALSVIHLWDAPDVVRQYLETGNESLREKARASARAAANVTSTADAPADAAANAAYTAAANAAYAADAAAFAARVASAYAASAYAADAADAAADAAATFAARVASAYAASAASAYAAASSRAAAYAAARDANRERLQKAVDDKFSTIPRRAYFMRSE
jgi:hypothetical protein